MTLPASAPADLLQHAQQTSQVVNQLRRACQASQLAMPTCALTVCSSSQRSIKLPGLSAVSRLCVTSLCATASGLCLQGDSQALQQRVEGLEAAVRRQDAAVDRLQAGAKRHMEASLRQGTTRKDLQQANQTQDKLRSQLSRLEAELAASRRCHPSAAAAVCACHGLQSCAAPAVLSEPDTHIRVVLMHAAQQQTCH